MDSFVTKWLLRMIVSGQLVLLGHAKLFTGCRKIDTVDDFDLDLYAEKSWYIQRQQINTYQPADFLFCVTATYRLEGKKQWFKDAITVDNRANQGGVNIGGGGGPQLCATRPNAKKHPAWLQVAPCFLPPFLAGDYRVVALADDYSWSMVIGGQPDVKGKCGKHSADNDLCTVREAGVIPFLPSLGNGQGLWFLTRESMPDPSVLETMESVAAELGICTARMVDVVHEGCTYNGFPLKL